MNKFFYILKDLGVKCSNSYAKDRSLAQERNHTLWGIKKLLELLMPAGLVTVLKSNDILQDDLSMTIVRGLCKDIREVVDETVLGPRVRLCFEMK